MTAEDTVQMGGVRFLEVPLIHLRLILSCQIFRAIPHKGKRQLKCAYKPRLLLSIIEYSNKIEKSEDIYEVGYR